MIEDREGIIGVGAKWIPPLDSGFAARYPINGAPRRLAYPIE